MTSQPSLLRLGVVGRARGLRGSFFVSYRQEPIPLMVKTVLIGSSPESATKFHVQSSSMSGQRVFLQLKEITERDQVKNIANQIIWAFRENIKIDDSAEFLVVDLIGKRVMDVKDTEIGTITDAYHTAFDQVNIVITDPNRKRDLDITFTHNYFDMSFDHRDPIIRCVHDRSIFDEIWNEKK